MWFTKMQALGNDFICLDAVHQRMERLPELARYLCDRHFGVGADGMVLICPSGIGDFRMRIFNPDGTEAQMCGNALRCAGKYVYDHRMTDQTELKIETLGGVRKAVLSVSDGVAGSIRTDMGEPEFEAARIPVRTGRKDFIRQPVMVSGVRVLMTAMSWGNPHAVVFSEEVAGLDTAGYGREIEHMTELFPEKTNVTFAQFDVDGSVKIREWERGAGETISCGTGCCSAVVAGVLEGLCGRSTAVEQIGGMLYVEWEEETNHVFLTGPSQTVFEAEIRVPGLIKRYEDRESAVPVSSFGRRTGERRRVYETV